MLTRLRVQGFKNLVDVEVHFGPFTVIAGSNGVGKSNLFDAIYFLSLLANRPFTEAAGEVRGGEDLRELFTAGGDGRMRFECDVVIPKVGVDEFGRELIASFSVLTYCLMLSLDKVNGLLSVKLLEESLVGRTSPAHPFAFEISEEWLRSIWEATDRSASLIETRDKTFYLEFDTQEAHPDGYLVPQDYGVGDEFDFGKMQRSVLSAAQGASPTALLLRQEMASWRVFHFNPQSLRAPSRVHDPAHLNERGDYLAATLHRLAQTSGDPDAIYVQVSNRLSELVEGVRSIRTEHDEVRGLTRILLMDRRGIELPASSLSDGTLRFLALIVLELDQSITGLLCFEEPETGIHPQNILSTLELFQDMSVDTRVPVEAGIGIGNSLRQVMVSTHSPVVVGQSDPGDVLFARNLPQRISVPGGEESAVVEGFHLYALPGSWRQRAGMDTMPRGLVWEYLDSNRRPPPYFDPEEDARVADWIDERIEVSGS